MNAEDLIRDGSLEAYVLGQASAQEAAMIEKMRVSDPRIADELEHLEETMLLYAQLASVAPPPSVKRAIMEQVAQGSNGASTPVIQLTNSTGSRPVQRMNWLAAASITGLALSAGLNFIQYKELDEVRTELVRSQNDRSVLAQELQVQRAAFDRTNEQLAVVLDPHAEVVQMDGSGPAEGKNARIYWDKASRSVHFDPLTISEPPAGMQYQLWALVDGQPVDAGMIALDHEAGTTQRMKDIPQAQAFAVTIEKLGGSPTPNLAALVLMGQV